MSKELIARIEEQWAMLDPVDPLRVVLDDVFEALAAPLPPQRQPWVGLTKKEREEATG